MLRQYELVDLVKSYDPDADEDALNRAYVFAMKKHGAQLRTSGDPYYSHPVEVAGILTKFKLDSVSIIAGLLHDTVEDTDTTVEEVRELFGDQVAQIVDGLTKLAKIEQKSANNKQAENFRKLLLAMSEDIRVLLIKLADRLHNMRTLHFCAPEKRARIARETLDIYAPLAERIGMQEVKSELEEIAFAELHKEAHDSIVARLNFLREKDSNLVPKIIEQLQKDMEENGIKAVVSGREKRLIPFGAKCSRRTRRSNSCQILWLSALLLTTWRPAIRHWVLCTANITWFRAVLRIIFRRRSRTAISPFTPASSDRKIRVLKFRYARTKCTKSAKKAWLRTGPINRAKSRRQEFPLDTRAAGDFGTGIESRRVFGEHQTGNV